MKANTVPDDSNLIGQAIEFVSMCQESMAGLGSCDDDYAIPVTPRELRQPESAAFDAACDMLERAFDAGFRRTKSPTPRGKKNEKRFG